MRQFFWLCTQAIPRLIKFKFHEMNEFIIIYFIETTIKMSLSDNTDS